MAPDTPDQTPDKTPDRDTSGPDRSDRPDRPIRQDGSLLDMPRPPKRTRSKLVWVFVLAVLVAGAALWQLRDLVLRDAVPDRQANMTGTDAAILGPNATNGTLPSMVPMDGDAAAGAQADANATAAVQGVNATSPDGAFAQDDAVVRFAFVEDVANWLVENYYPKGTHMEARTSGWVAPSLKSANMRYGVNMTGLSWSGDDISAGRASVLDYAFTPAMLEALQRLYADRFMTAMAAAASNAKVTDKGKERTLTPAEVAEMYTLYATRLRGLSGALREISGMTDAVVRVNAWLTAQQTALEANAKYQDAVFGYDTAREGNSAHLAEQARRIMELSGKAYQQAIMARERARETLAEAVRRNPDARRLDDDTLVYAAGWVYRRANGKPEKMDAVRMAATVLADTAARFDRAAQASRQ
ncbi:hypothetical protein [Nitratidesulfovibrio liaohensis]|uniref:hypothetical protein n=1 Tax=Nitratidesulfovibrio liaohensis TaxID=2604158 RepID=UPI00141EDA75|nr:hypothetical protein [Nitratidesulfovibrio liaohensis]NHZ47357.1 hypothetical protein [Nitratidesulfovibrio liaohensis]